jgi:hypothetical protein
MPKKAVMAPPFRRGHAARTFCAVQMAIASYWLIRNVYCQPRRHNWQWQIGLLCFAARYCVLLAWSLIVSISR